MRMLPILCVLLVLPFAATAQDRDQTLADIRQDLNLLNVEIQRLKRELSTTGGSGVGGGSGPILDRISTIEGELQRLTGKTEELEYRINRIVQDGTNRIGDLEFRLVELEGGDIRTLGETSTLGGEESTTPAAPAPAPRVTEQPETGLAVGERDDYRRAEEALASGDFRRAAELFAAFNETYPGGPLGPKAALRRGDALAGLGDTREAARAYLDAYSMEPGGTAAPEAMLKLGRALGALEQVDAACQTLGQLETRFPQADEVLEARAEMRNLGCF